MKTSKYTLEILQNEALKYKYRKDFSEYSYPFYKSALRQNLLNKICSHMTRPNKVVKWNLFLLQEQALKYKTRSDFQKYSFNAWQNARKKNLLDKICSHMTDRFIWTYDLLKKEAAKYSSLSDFRKNSPSACQICYQRKIIDEITKHMEKNSPSDNDTIYIWRALDLGKWNDKDIYKIGVTSKRLGLDRIVRCSKDSGLNYEIVIIKNLKSNARKLESLLLKIGDVVKMNEFNGSTEFRALSQQELLKALEILD